MRSQAGTLWISLMADYLIAETALPEQLLNDANLWLDQARALLRLTLSACVEGLDGGGSAPPTQLQEGIEGLERLLQMAQGCVSQAHRGLLLQQLAAARGEE